VAEGATLQSGKTARLETFTGKKVLADGKRPVEIYLISDNSHVS